MGSQMPREDLSPLGSTPEAPAARADLGPMARVLAVIEAIAYSEDAVALRDVEEKTGLPKPTVHRILSHLERMGYLQRAMGRKSYFAGSRLAALSLAAVRNRWAHHETHKILADLVARLGETCNITILDGYRVFLVDRVETHWPLRFVMHANTSFPLHCTASGKLYLALMPAKRRAWYFANHRLTASTPNTITDPRKLEKSLAAIRRQLYSLDNEELVAGLVAAAVPIMDSQGRLLGTVAANATNARITAEKIVEHVPLLRQAAAAIAKAQES